MLLERVTALQNKFLCFCQSTQRRQMAKVFRIKRIELQLDSLGPLTFGLKLSIILLLLWKKETFQ